MDLVQLQRLTQYLPLLKRTLLVMRYYHLRQEPEGILFCSYLADDLHNLPEFLLHYNSFKDDYILNFARERYQYLPESLRVAWNYIYMEAHNDIKLLDQEFMEYDIDNTDLFNYYELIESRLTINIAPIPKLTRYLSMMGTILTGIRNRWHRLASLNILKHSELIKHEIAYLPPTTDVEWTQQDTESALFWGQMTNFFAFLPEHLLYWTERNETQFLEELRSFRAELPSRSWEWWDFHFSTEMNS